MSGTPTGNAMNLARAREEALIGRTISGRYRIESRIGSGGMGAVFRGEHLHMRKHVAIKVLHGETKGLEGLVAQFEREAVAGGHIDHANVASATDFGELEDGSYFLVQEYLRGVTLSELLEKGPVSADRAIHIARQTAEGLAAVHEMGIVHRDVKSENIMLIAATDDHVKLIDFGFAKVPMERMSVSRADDPLSQDDTDADTVFGTIAYLAPEAARGMDALDQRSDLYALGVIMYEMITGTRPFGPGKAAEVFRQHREDAPPPFVARAPLIPVPAAVEAITMRLLAKDPADRFQSGGDVVAALNRAVAGRARAAERAKLDGADIEIPDMPRGPRLGRMFIMMLFLSFALGGAFYGLRQQGLLPPWLAALPDTWLADPTAEPTALEAPKTEVDGIGAAGWTARMLAAPGKKDWKGGAKALAALAELDPTALRAPEVFRAVGTLTIGVAQMKATAQSATTVFELLAQRFGADGIDVLYSVIESRPPTGKAAKRAADELGEPETLARGTPALRIAMELREAPCEKKAALFARAAANGDARALKVLSPLKWAPCRSPQHPCCFRNHKVLEDTLRTLKDRRPKK